MGVCGFVGGLLMQGVSVWGLVGVGGWGGVCVCGCVCVCVCVCDSKVSGTFGTDCPFLLVISLVLPSHFSYPYLLF